MRLPTSIPRALVPFLLALLALPIAAPSRAGIASIQQTQTQCIKPRPGNLCYLSVGYVSVSSTPEQMKAMTIEIDGVVAARIGAFFSNHVYYDGDQTLSRFQLACGYAGTNTLADPKLGGQHQMVVWAENYIGSRVSNTAQVICPPGDRPPKKKKK